MEKQSLQAGKVYDTILKEVRGEYKGKALYIGTLKRDVINRHVMVFDGELGIKVCAFRDYIFENGKIEITSKRELRTSPLERKYLRTRLTKALAR